MFKWLYRRWLSNPAVYPKISPLTVAGTGTIQYWRWGPKYDYEDLAVYVRYIHNQYVRYQSYRCDMPEVLCTWLRREVEIRQMFGTDYTVFANADAAYAYIDQLLTELTASPSLSRTVAMPCTTF